MLNHYHSPRKFSWRQIDSTISYFSQIIGFDILYKLAPKQPICVKFHKYIGNGLNNGTQTSLCNRIGVTCMKWQQYNSTEAVQEAPQTQNIAHQRHQENEQTNQDRKHTRIGPKKNKVSSPLSPNKVITMLNNTSLHRNENEQMKAATFYLFCEQRNLRTICNLCNLQFEQCLNNAGPYQQAQLRRLIWAFVVRLQNQWIL